MALSLDLLQGTLDKAVPTLNRWRQALIDHLSFPLLSTRGVYKKDVAIKGSGTRVEPGFRPSTYIVFRLRAGTVTGVIETAIDDRGVTLVSGVDCTADIWFVP